jgi:hypothetical protein
MSAPPIGPSSSADIHPTSSVPAALGEALDAAARILGEDRVLRAAGGSDPARLLCGRPPRSRYVTSWSCSPGPPTPGACT